MVYHGVMLLLHCALVLYFSKISLWSKIAVGVPAISFTFHSAERRKRNISVSLGIIPEKYMLHHFLLIFLW